MISCNFPASGRYFLIWDRCYDFKNIFAEKSWLFWHHDNISNNDIPNKDILNKDISNKDSLKIDISNDDLSNKDISNRAVYQNVKILKSMILLGP
jgi:hypothetical protein